MPTPFVSGAETIRTYSQANETPNVGTGARTDGRAKLAKGVSEASFSPKPVAVLHLFKAMDRGGAELRTIQLTAELDLSTVRTLFGTLSGREGALAPEIRANGGEVIPLRLGLAWPVRFARALRLNKVDVVHSHVATFSGFPLAVAALCGVDRRIAHFRSEGDLHGTELRYRLQRAVMRRMVTRFATDVVGVSPEALNFGIGEGTQLKARTSVIPSGLDTRTWESFIGRAQIDTMSALPRAQGHSAIVHIGRSAPEKNRARAVSIVAALATAGEMATLFFVGRITESECNELSALATDHGIADRVVFLGERDDVPRLLFAADLTLLTSTREGLPGVVLESCAAGTPTVASALPGVRWLAETFPLVRPVDLEQRDSEWADAIRRSLDLPRDSDTRLDALRTFEASEFHLSRALDSFTTLWTGR